MSVDECIASYEKLASKIFNAGIMSKIGSGASTGARFSATVLEDAIKKVVKQATGSADASMRDTVLCMSPIVKLFAVTN